MELSDSNIQKVLFTEKQIQERVLALATQISQDYAGKSIIVCGLLKGAFLLVADLSRRLTVRNQVDFIVASSYGAETTSSGSVNLKKFELPKMTRSPCFRTTPSPGACLPFTNT